MKKLKIKISKNLTISNESKSVVVAEISANHNGSLNLLKKTMLAAKKCGADAVKIQSYQANTMTLNFKNEHFQINDKSIWKGQNLYSLYKSAETPFKWHKDIFRFARKIDILCFSAPFDISAVNLLEKCGCPIYKIASPEIEDLNLIKAVAKTMKPIIISTGIADINNIKEAIDVCKKVKNNNVILLNCISSYPAKSYELNLLHIKKLKKFTEIVGFSDHSQTDLACLISIGLGAKIIEKHFILNKNINSPDKNFSYNPKQFKNLIQKIRLVEEMLGKENVNKRKILKGKLKTVTRSIFYTKNIIKGEIITKNNIKSIRPGTGLRLKYFDKIIGMKAKKNILGGQPVKFKDLKK